MAKLLDVNEIRCDFDYSPETGKLTARKPRGKWGRYKVGTEVGWVHKCGAKTSEKLYLRVNYKGSVVYVHRIIWVLMTGVQPETIDHIDGNGLNNKWSNLRNVHHRINGKNQKLHTTNTSGTSGVCYRSDSKKWRSRIMVDDRMISLGTFETKDEAISIRKKAEKDLWV